MNTRLNAAKNLPKTRSIQRPSASFFAPCGCSSRQSLRPAVGDDGDQAGLCFGTDEQIAELAQVGLSTVHRVRQRCVEEGLEAALQRKPSPQRQYRKLDGAQEAKLVALACSDPPAGRVCWTMQLLADKLVELDIVDSIGREAVRTTLKKTRFSRGERNSGCCLPSTTPSSSARWKTC